MRRRLDICLHFGQPCEAARLQIWQGIYQFDLEIEEELDLTRIAERFELSGGYIKRAIRQSVLGGAMRTGGRITQDQLWLAACRQARELGILVRHER